MNQIVLYHLWRRVEFAVLSNGEIRPLENLQLSEEETDEGVMVAKTLVRYQISDTVTSLDEAQAATQGSNGHLVYTFSEAWYGEQG